VIDGSYFVSHVGKAIEFDTDFASHHQDVVHQVKGQEEMSGAHCSFN
jgi:hypothetical protein